MTLSIYFHVLLPGVRRAGKVANRPHQTTAMRKPYQPPPYVEAELAAEIKANFPMVFGSRNIIEGDRFHVGYRLEGWSLTAMVNLRWQLAGEGESQQAVPYSYLADAAVPGGFKWVCEQA